MMSLLASFLIGVIAAFFGSMVGGGSLLSVSFLIFLGLPPQVAIATDRFGSIGQVITAYITFTKANKVVRKYVPLLSIISLIGSFIGAQILFVIDPVVLKSIISVLMFLLLPLVLMKPTAGLKHRIMSKKTLGFGLVSYFLIQIYGGFFGAGSGPLVFYILVLTLGLTFIEANATQLIPWFVLSLTSLILFAQKGIIDYRLGLPLMLGMATGGYIGSHTALKIGDVWIKRMFVFLVVISGLKLIFF